MHTGTGFFRGGGLIPLPFLWATFAAVVQAGWIGSPVRAQALPPPACTIGRPVQASANPASGIQQVKAETAETPEPAPYTFHRPEHAVGDDPPWVQPVSAEYHEPIAAPLPPPGPFFGNAVVDEREFVEPWAEPGFDFLPWHLLWEPPLASPHQPRMYAKLTTLSNENSTDTIDSAIGGTFGLFRYQPCCLPETAYQLDFFAVMFGRWSEFNSSVAADYRFGFPLTFRHGNWEGKIGYEHTSTHLGDDFIEKTGRRQVHYVRDEIVLGLAYRWWETFRVYGEFGYAYSFSSPVDNGRERFGLGVEWSRRRPTGWEGQPFAALDIDLRPEQGYTPNLTAQLGWQWVPRLGRPSARLALEYYNGKSPFGQFLTENEDWLGLGMYIDF